MKTIPIVLLVAMMITWQCSTAPPVTKNKGEEIEVSPDALEQVMHYHRYLKQVVGALETDPEFKKKLEQAEESDIRSGKIANELEFVSHQVRTQLDELKRQEMMRLHDYTEKKKQLSDNEIVDDPNHAHLDRHNPHTFEIEDLKKLIAKTTEDLAEADRKRREEFKHYEMQKEYEKQNKLNHTNGDERDKLEKEYQENDAKHKKHQPLHEPGHKAQLEEVWEEQDHMQQQFDPKIFFMMHDLDSDGLWDQNEVKALFIKELNKMYEAGAPEDDLRERIEEMERMRESVFQEIDTNRDGFIDFQEFMIQTKKHEFQQDHGWKGLDEQKVYTDEEWEAFLKEQQMMHPPSPGYQGPPPGAYPPPVAVPPAYHPNPAYQPQFQANPQLNTNEIYHQQGSSVDAHQANVGQQHYQTNQGQPVQNNQGQPPQQNQGQQHYQKNQGQAAQANQGQLLQYNQAHPPQPNQGQLPQYNQGQLPQPNQGQQHYQANQGQAPQPNQGRPHLQQ